MIEIDDTRKSGFKYLRTILKNYRIDINGLSEYLRESKVIVICDQPAQVKVKQE